jgi:hypothetical protein
MREYNQQPVAHFSFKMYITFTTLKNWCLQMEFITISRSILTSGGYKVKASKTSGIFDTILEKIWSSDREHLTKTSMYGKTHMRKENQIQSVSNLKSQHKLAMSDPLLCILSFLGFGLNLSLFYYLPMPTLLPANLFAQCFQYALSFFI